MIQLQIPVDKLLTQIPRGVQYPLCVPTPPGVLEPVCTGGRYGVHSHITEGLAGAVIYDSADCSAEAGDDPAEALAV